MSRSEDSLEAEFTSLVPRWAERYLIATIGGFADFFWDADMRFEELVALDGALTIDSVVGPRRMVVQRVRGELRYWLASHRDPMTLTNSGEHELGTVASLNDLVRLCDEFLVGGVAFSELSTSRMTGVGGTVKKGRSV